MSIIVIKIMAALIIIGTSSKIGIDYAGKLSKRLKEIRSLRVALTAIEGEMAFSCMPLADIFRKVSTNMPKGLENVFCEVSSIVKNKNGETVERAFETAIKNNRKHLELNDADLQVLKDFASLIGKTDLDNQLKNLQLTQKNFELCEVLAQEDCRKYGKMYRSLGVLAGILITVLMM